MIPAYKGQVIVSWANIHLLKGDAEISTYWNETGRVLVIIGSFYADILVVLGTNPGVWGTNCKVKKHWFIWFLMRSKSVCFMSLSRGLLDICFGSLRGL